MIYIAHRGNLYGPNPDVENHPDQIELCIKSGFDVEIDVRFVDNKWVLGHDEPQYEVGLWFLKKQGLWVHAKNMDAFVRLVDQIPINSFFHDTDDVVLTTHRWLWVYPGKPLLHRKCIAVMPEKVPDYDIKHAAGICSDFVANYKDNYK